MTKPEGEAAFRGALPMQVRLAEGSQTFNPDTREVEIIVSTGATVRRMRMDGWDMVPYNEELTVSASAVNMERLNDGAAVLDSHRAYGGIAASLGIVQRAWVEGGKLLASVRLHAEGVSEQADALAGMIRGGTAPKVSVGYTLDKVRVVEGQSKKDIERWIVERWTPYEVSFVTVPADAGAGVRSKDQTYPCEVNRASPPNHEEKTMADTIEKTSPGEQPVETRAAAPSVDATAVRAEAVKAERIRVVAIRTIATAHKLPDELVAKAIDNGTEIDAFRASVLDHLAAEQEKTPTVNATTRASGDDPAVKRAAMTEALVARILRRNPEGDHARSYMDFGFADMAAEMIGDTRRMTASRRDDVLHRAFHTTSDFPGLLENVANKSMLARYGAANQTFKTIALQKNFSDFKVHSVVRPGDFPTLLQVAETGAIKAGTISESKETVQLYTYARQVRFSRNMLINDDLNAMGDVLSAIGQRVADFESATFWAAFAANPNLVTDSTAVWASGHGNLAGAGGAISDTTIGAGWAAMMKQTSLDGIKLNVSPKYLIVSPDKLTEALKATVAITNPTSTANANVQGALLTPVADANLSGNAWYLQAEPGAAATHVYGYLDGAAGPQTRIDEPFGVLGTAMQVILDFGVGAIDYRGTYKNPGA